MLPAGTFRDTTTTTAAAGAVNFSLIILYGPEACGITETAFSF